MFGEDAYDMTCYNRGTHFRPILQPLLLLSWHAQPEGAASVTEIIWPVNPFALLICLSSMHSSHAQFAYGQFEQDSDDADTMRGCHKQEFFISSNTLQNHVGDLAVVHSCGRHEFINLGRQPTRKER